LCQPTAKSDSRSRHAIAGHLVVQGVDLQNVKKFMGYSDIQTTMIYAHLAPDHPVGAGEELPFA
jgi:site-specific recombinase XerD